jgi:dihydrofolate reductase
MNINIIFAISKNNAIGKNGKLPWNIKEDLLHFRKTTIGNGNNAIIMGRKTWESIGSKSLKNRHNIIISSKSIQNNNINCSSFNNIDNCLDFCKEKKFNNIWIIGGSTIYTLFLNKYKNLINKLVITYIDKHFFNCDSFIDFNVNDWCILDKHKLYNYDNIYVYTLKNKFNNHNNI